MIYIEEVFAKGWNRILTFSSRLQVIRFLKWHQLDHKWRLCSRIKWFLSSLSRFLIPEFNLIICKLDLYLDYVFVSNSFSLELFLVVHRWCPITLKNLKSVWYTVWHCYLVYAWKTTIGSIWWFYLLFHSFPTNKIINQLVNN